MSDRPRRRGPRRATEKHLANAAEHYVARYATSTENLRRVLMRKVQRSSAAHGTDAEEGAAWVDAILARYAAAGLLDDEAYAEMRARRLGPFAAAADRAARRERHLAALARAGFSYDTARRVIEATDADDLLTEAGLTS